ncbi:MAG: anthranilate synthase component I family protein [Planctomycetota bacterium]
MNHFEPTRQLPLVVPLPEHVTPGDAFRSLGVYPNRLWLDSATGWPAARSDSVEELVRGLSRYSFVTAAPLTVLQASPEDPSPWDELNQLAAWLPSTIQEGLPPFQGGIAGLLGYEAARWLPELELAGSFEHQRDEWATPACSLGFYDWVIAFDHLVGKAWLICQGFTDEDVRKRQHPSLAARYDQARRRVCEVLDVLDQGSNNRDSVAFTVFPIDEGYETPFDALRSNFSSDGYRAMVADIVERIRSGDSFQVNVAQQLSCGWEGEIETLYESLRHANPAPFGAFYDTGRVQVLSTSPERFLSVRDRVVQTRPIKGTVARTGNVASDGRLAENLLRSEKDRAENTMIVDLMRNDLSRVCDDASVVVKQLCQVERYQFVQHLVSVVEGQLRNDASCVDLLRACFPGGSVTGAPKTEAMRTIAALEPHTRGPYCGTIGYLGCGGNVDFNILIRTLTVEPGRLRFQVGGGITARSIPEAEEAETWTKARGILKALEHAGHQAVTGGQLEVAKGRRSG